MPERYKRYSIAFLYVYIVKVWTSSGAFLYNLLSIHLSIVYVILQCTLASPTFVVVICIKEILNLSLCHVFMKFLMKFQEK